MFNSWQYHLIRLTSRGVCLMPYSLLLIIGRLVGRLYYFVANRPRTRALAQAQESLALSLPETEKIIRSLFAKLGQTLLEVMYIPKLNPAKMEKYVEIQNRNYLEEALAAGKGVAILTAHIGNWEWLGAALAMAGFPVASIVKKQPNDQHTRIINEYRVSAGIEIFTCGTAELVGAAKTLKRGKILGFFSDLDVGNKGIFIEFFGRRASTPMGLAFFARKMDVPVIPAFIVRRPDGGHRIIISPALRITKSEDEGSDIREFTAQATKLIEDTIRLYPDEWVWFQKRWNTKWAGEQA